MYQCACDLSYHVVCGHVVLDCSCRSENHKEATMSSDPARQKSSSDLRGNSSSPSDQSTSSSSCTGRAHDVATPSPAFPLTEGPKLSPIVSGAKPNTPTSSESAFKPGRRLEATSSSAHVQQKAVGGSPAVTREPSFSAFVPGSSAVRPKKLFGTEGEKCSVQSASTPSLSHWLVPKNPSSSGGLVGGHLPGSPPKSAAEAKSDSDSLLAPAVVAHAGCAAETTTEQNTVLHPPAALASGEENVADDCEEELDDDMKKALELSMQDLVSLGIFLGYARVCLHASLIVNFSSTNKACLVAVSLEITHCILFGSEQWSSVGTWLIVMISGILESIFCAESSQTKLLEVSHN